MCLAAGLNEWNAGTERSVSEPALKVGSGKGYVHEGAVIREPTRKVGLFIINTLRRVVINAILRVPGLGIRYLMNKHAFLAALLVNQTVSTARKSGAVCIRVA